MQPFKKNFQNNQLSKSNSLKNVLSRAILNQLQAKGQNYQSWRFLLRMRLKPANGKCSEAQTLEQRLGFKMTGKTANDKFFQILQTKCMIMMTQS